MKKISVIIIAAIILSMLSACNNVTETDQHTSSVPIYSSTAASLEETVSSELPSSSEEQSSSEAPSSSQPASSSSAVQSSTQAVISSAAPPPPVSNDPATVNVTPKVVNVGKTFTGLPVLEAIKYTVNDPNNTRGLSTVRSGFSFGVAKNETPHSITVNNQERFDGYALNALAWDNKTEGKPIYLTFDCGYKYSNLTERILNTLKEKNVKAAFFCTLDYLEDDPAMVSRMITEGHIVGNHTATHPDCTTISRTRFAEELLGVNNYLRVNYGYDSKYFRFPTGAYNQNAIELAYSLGFRSIFWSVAYADWDPANQPGVDNSFEQVTSRLHPGAVILLHSTSPDNADILGKVIDHARAKGYEFKTLDEYGYWK